MSLINKEKLLLDFIKEKFALPNFYLVDIGVSGGFHDIWRSFGEKLVALGVDSLENEVNRLIKQETLGNVMYISAFCGSGNKQEQHKDVESNYPLHKTLAYLTTSLLSLNKIKISRDEYLHIRNQIISGKLYKIPKEANFSNVPQPEQDPFVSFYVKRFNNHNSSIQKSANIQTVDNLVKKVKKFNRIDLLKIDTDGNELSVLAGAGSVLENTSAIEIEVQFHGLLSKDSSTFCNIDSFLRNKGFSLFKLCPVLYSRSALPVPFLYKIPAQNKTGQIMWADALYINEKLAYDSKEKLRSLAILLDAYGLADAAAEVLINYPGLFDEKQDTDSLNFLAAKVHGIDIGFDEVISEYLKSIISF